ncbi:hypothetical protein ACHAWO_004607 [Cyclotella atomus]|uniref:Uncharacterized protein n=1 Tax=Cyclotella atomus TaxID=382360 RepID=A0ABD3PM77_9STRA
MSPVNSSLDEIPLSQQPCITQTSGSSSPKLTKRVKGVKYTYSKPPPDKNNGATTINIVNNFGIGSVNHFTDWKDAAVGGKKNRNVKLSWCLLRSCLSVVLVIWAGACVTVFRSHPASEVGAKNKEMPKHRFRGRKVIVRKSHKPKSEVRSRSRSEATAAAEEDDEASKENSTETEINVEDLPNATTAFGEDVAYSLAHPSVFRTNTPHAPSCEAPLDVADISFTLVSQLSYDRIWMIPQHCKRWGNNPISVAVFSNRNATEVKDDAVSKGCTEEQLTVQTVNREKYDPTGTEYPVNILRNLALSAVKTSHVIYADVDFWPASNLHAILTEPSVKERFASDPYLATVIPAFQMVRQCSAWRDCKEKNIPKMPKDKEALLDMVAVRKASSFDPTNKGGHGSTKYATWRSQEEGNFVDLPCIQSNRYEPYLALRYCSDLPPFQEGFTGYGKNKMSWAMQLRRSGYQFSQLGGAFLVHYPHLDSKSREEWNKKPDLLHQKPLDALAGEDKEQIDWSSFKRARVDALFIEYRKWLGSSVEDKSRVPMCDDAQNDDVRLWVHPAMIES